MAGLLRCPQVGSPPFGSDSRCKAFQLRRQRQCSAAPLGVVSATRRVRTHCALKARWSFDVRFGRKTEATKLLQQWIREIGTVAGLKPGHVCIRSGAIGAPESRLEMEVTSATMQDLEEFWGSIPAEAHRDWCGMIQDMIVHGTPVWEVYRDVPVSFGEAPAAIEEPTKLYASKEVDLGIRGLQIVDGKDEAAQILKGNSTSPEDPFFWEEDPMPSNFRTTESGLSIVESADDAEQLLDSFKGERDWKGDPLKRNPGDKIPRIQ
mmetsp:Transcript_9452/g.23997  ORF Transcript_9452/g.23997 Transcript_9452/m.23997 type:complete len:264 (-) Transcript_9452:568-1359(-)